MTGPERGSVAGRLAEVRTRIEAAGGDVDAVRVVAVTKGFGVEEVTAARQAGLADIGENYVAELLDKASLLDGDADIRWHFLGAVQRNKVGRLAPRVALWQGVTREVEGRAIARQGPGAAVLVEVDLTGIPGRRGCRPEQVPALVSALRQLDLDVRGLMTVAARAPGERRPAFRTLRELADEQGLPERSMGMTDDLEEAVAEGSTMVRVGRALFGPRAERVPRRDA